MPDDALGDRVILVTGATGALGSAITREFARTGACLALAARSAQRIEQMAIESRLPEQRLLAVQADVTRAEDVARLVEAATARFGRIDALLNTVGGWSGGKPVSETSLEEWGHMLALNLQSAFLLSRAVLPAMLKAGWGRIVHISSKTAVTPQAKQAAYAVSKMGLITLTEVMAAEIKGSGVTVNVILPSIIDTPANRAVMPNADTSKWVSPERIAALLRFLCSEDAASINGARIPIYGAV